MYTSSRFLHVNGNNMQLLEEDLRKSLCQIDK